MALFGFGKKVPLDDMISEAESRRKSMLEGLEEGEMKHCIVYKDGRWEVQFLLGATDRLKRALSAMQKKPIEFVMMTADMDYGTIPLALFRFYGDKSLSYSCIVSADRYGSKGSVFESIDFFKLLMEQKTVYIILVSDGREQNMIELNNPFVDRPYEMAKMRSSVRSSILKGDVAYFQAKVKFDQYLKSQTYRIDDPDLNTYEKIGQLAWGTYEQNKR